jgi:hypothetical protein
MLVLSTLHAVLSQLISPPVLHTAVLFTPEGQLLSHASDGTKSKDDIRVLVAVSAEIWQSAKDAEGAIQVESEVPTPR